MKKTFWNVRTRLLLTLGLVVLPAAALIWFGFEHLTSIQKEHTVQSAIHGEVQQRLTTFDKRLSERAYAMVDPIRAHFPSPLDKDVNEQLDKILAANPWVSSTFIFDKTRGTILRLGPADKHDAESMERAAKFSGMINLWFGEAGEDMLAQMRRAVKDGAPPYYPHAEASSGDTSQPYQPMLFFPIDAAP